MQRVTERLAGLSAELVWFDLEWVAVDDDDAAELMADPALDRNTHTIKVEADSARLTMTIENVPSEENPGTGKITALSVIAALRGLVAPLRVGT